MEAVMKYAIIIPEGAPDVPQDELEGCTPLGVAATDAIDELAARGRTGTAVLTPESLPCTDDVTLLALLGYDPRVHRCRAAGLEALAAGVDLGADDVAIRLSLVTARDGRLVHLSADGMTDAEGAALYAALEAAVTAELGEEAAGWRIVATGEHRGLLIHDGKPDPFETTPPAVMMQRPFRRHLPEGAGAPVLRAIIELSGEVFASHEVNRTRVELGELAATHVWPWGEGGRCVVPSFAERHDGLRGVMICQDALPAGIARLVGWDCIRLGRDVDERALGLKAVDALDEYDIVGVCAPTPDAASHQGDVNGKMSALTAIDRHIVAPLREWIEAYDDWRMLVAPTHSTRTGTGCHAAEPVPVLFAGARVTGVRTIPFREDTAAESDLHIEVGDELMEYFLFGSGVRRGHVT
jgi:2,3-bisphosphoglycerate-independent phosphoglycerate mutase